MNEKTVTPSETFADFPIDKAEVNHRHGPPQREKKGRVQLSSVVLEILSTKSVNLFFHGDFFAEVLSGLRNKNFAIDIGLHEKEPLVFHLHNDVYPLHHDQPSIHILRLRENEKPMENHPAFYVYVRKAIHDTWSEREHFVYTEESFDQFVQLLKGLAESLSDLMKIDERRLKLREEARKFAEEVKRHVPKDGDGFTYKPIFRFEDGFLEFKILATPTLTAGDFTDEENLSPKQTTNESVEQNEKVELILPPLSLHEKGENVEADQPVTITNCTTVNTSMTTTTATQTSVLTQSDDNVSVPGGTEILGFVHPKTGVEPCMKKTKPYYENEDEFDEDEDDDQSTTESSTTTTTTQITSSTSEGHTNVSPSWSGPLGLSSSITSANNSGEKETEKKGK